jgi:uncharacterized protein YbbC (DUF1343 family)
VQVIVSDSGLFRPFVTYLALIVDARNQDPEHFDWRSDVYEFESERPAIDLLLGRADLRPRLESGESLDGMEASWSEELGAFDTLRRRFLLYP